jgi:hypothetical protein
VNQFRPAFPEKKLNQGQLQVYIFAQPGTDVMIFKMFSPKNLRTKWRFWLKIKLNYSKLDHNIGYWEKSQSFRRNCRKF